jgi:hypothetical protein
MSPVRSGSFGRPLSLGFDWGPKGESLTLANSTRHAADRHQCGVRGSRQEAFFLLAGTFYLVAAVIHRQHVTGQVQRNTGPDRCGRADGSGVIFAIISGAGHF